MNLNLEPINLSIDPEEVTVNLDTNKGSIAGVELLANNKFRESDNKLENINDLNDLETQLNDLVLESDVPPPPVNSVYDNININNNEPDIVQSWDGFSKLDSIGGMDTKEEQAIKKEDTVKEKFKYLRLLEELEKKGVTLTKKYDMESSLLEMQGEYETLINEKEKSNSVKFQGKMLMAMITGLEFMNTKFDPFDVKLDGWGEQVNENLNEYDEIFSELHEKYKSKGKMAPEIKLLFQLAGSGIMIHMTNTMFKSSMPGMDDIMRQNPDLMHKFTQAAVDQMGKNNPGFGNFMNMSKPDNNVSSRPDLNFAKQPEYRADMKGPDDISELLSGLKTKKDDDIESISVGDFKEVNNENKPSKSRRRRNNSDKNTVSLNL